VALILVTGAAGKTGMALCQALLARHAPVRAFVRRPSQVPIMQALGIDDVVVGDMRVQADVGRAVHGVQAIVHICSNMNPDEIPIGHLFIAAARRKKVERFVYYSVLHPQTEDMPHHWNKLRVEEALFQTELQYTILQPASYMQNILPGWKLIVEEGIYRVPYTLETRLGLVDLDDVALATAIVLTEPGHAGATYELATDEVLSQTQIADILGRGLGRPVQAEVLPLEAWERQARTSGLGDYQVEALLKMFRYYERYGLWGSANVLRWLLRREPTRFAAFVQRMVVEQTS